MERKLERIASMDCSLLSIILHDVRILFEQGNWRPRAGGVTWALVGCRELKIAELVSMVAKSMKSWLVMPSFAQPRADTFNLAAGLANRGVVLSLMWVRMTG